MAEPWQGAYANDTYLRSLAASTGDIDREVRNALTEIGRQRTTNQAAAGRVPGTVTGLMNDSQGRLAGDLFSLGTPQMESVRGYFDSGRQTYRTIGDLMKLGFGERATRQAGQVKNLNSDLLYDLRNKGMEYASRRESEDRQMAFQSQQAAAQRSLQEELARQQIAAQEAIARMQAEEAQKLRDIEIWNAAIAAGQPQPIPSLIPTLTETARYKAERLGQ